MKQRCAWCTSWGHGSVCDRCTAEMLPVEQFAPARMLVDAGVDRLSLAQRVRDLSRNQFVALSSRFDAQWSVLQKRADETKFIESFLVQRGFREAVEDLLIRRIPISDDELKTWTDTPRTDDLETIVAHSPIDLNRTLASIALLRQKKLSRPVFETVRYAVHAWEPHIAREAAFALALWFLRESRELPWLGRWDLETIATVARPVLADATLGPWAALAVRMSTDDPALDPTLRAGLNSGDPELRFGCALILRDETELGRALEGDDPLKASVARRTLSRFRSRLMFRRLAEDTDDAKLEIIRSLGHPAEPELIDALLTGAERARRDVKEAALNFIYQESFREISAESKRVIAEFLARASLTPELVLKSLDWAESDVAPFSAASTSMFEGLEEKQLAALIEDRRWDVRRWLSTAAGPREEILIDRWLENSALQKEILGLALDGENGRLVIGAWDRAKNKLGLAPALKEAIERHRGSRVRDALLPEFWARFKAAPDKDARVLVMSLLSPYRYELKELRSLEPRGGPFGNRDLSRFYETYAISDPLEAPNLLSEVLEQARQERGAAKKNYPQLAKLADTALAHAIEMAATRPLTALRIAANLASHIVNTYRTDEDHPDLVAAVDRVRAHYAPLMNALDHAAPVDASEARYSHVVEQLETELKIAGDVDERKRRQEEERLEREARQAELIAREAAREAAAREAERLARERAEREAEERARLIAERAAQVQAGGSAQITGSGPRPAIPTEGIDHEPLLPTHPLPTIYAYVAFMKAMQGGADVMQLMASHGMDPMSWSACATAWAALFQQRPNLAMRFATLLGAPWI